MSTPSTPSTLGKYEVRREIGRGSMGVVYEGLDPLIDRVVALKVLRLDDASPDAGNELRLRFRREAQAAGRLSHAGIVAIYEYGEAQDGQCAYIAMELVDGQDLKTVLASGRRFSFDETLQVASQLLSALQHAHDRKVVHRDIKPANILLLPNGEVKIADFGIARFDSSELTQAGAFLGTVSHMSPEQLFGHAIDQRTDIFSAAVVLYQMFTGTLAFSGSAATVIQKVLNVMPPAPSTLVATLPRALDEVLLKAMAKQPDERYPTAAAFRQALLAAATLVEADELDRTVIQRARPVIPPPPPSAHPPPPDDALPGPAAAPASAPSLPPAPMPSPAGPPQARGTSRPGLGIGPKAGVAVGVAACAAGLVWWLTSRPAPTSPSAPTPPSSSAAVAPAPAAPSAVPITVPTKVPNPVPSAAPSDRAAAAATLPVPLPAGSSPRPGPAASSPGELRLAAERAAWTEAQKAQKPEAYARFVRAYPGSVYAAEAQRRRAALEAAGQPVVAASAARAGEVATPAVAAASGAPASAGHCLEEARRGDLRCQLTLAGMYRAGRGVPVNLPEALHWTRQAAEQGSGAAQFELAQMYVAGQGTERNETQALAWAEKAAGQGLASAQTLAGLLYVERARSDPSQYEKAVEWYQRAAAQGVPAAMAAMANLSWYGRGTARDADKAVDWWKAACDKNFASSCYVLGQLFEGGVRAHPEESLRYYRKALAVPGLGEADRARAQAQIAKAR